MLLALMELLYLVMKMMFATLLDRIQLYVLTLNLFLLLIQTVCGNSLETQKLQQERIFLAEEIFQILLPTRQLQQL
jgi:hypothetical protein